MNVKKILDFVFNALKEKKSHVLIYIINDKIDCK